MTISKEKISKLVKSPYAITGSVAVLVVGIAAALGYYRQVQQPIPENTPTPSETATVEPTLTPSASPTPSVSPSPTISSTPANSVDNLPDSAIKKVDNFYSAYKAKSIQELSTMFTADSTSELKSLHARLFTGLDTDGTPGGPTLFSSNSASQSVSSYQITSSTKTESGWTLALTEQRLSGTGTHDGQVSTVLELTPAGDSWEIDAYYHAGSSGKYDGFLIQ